MKKTLFTLGLFLTLFVMSAQASKTTDRATVHKKSNHSIGNSIERSPVILPEVDIVFDTDERSINILSSVECEASVLLFDMNGNLIGFADSIATILYIPESINAGCSLIIDSDNWYATATLKI